MIQNFNEFKSSLITEKQGDTYDYGCAMVYFDFPQMPELHSQIDPADVYTEEADRTYGLENEPHTTLLYGLHSNDIPDETVIEKCKGSQIGPITLHNASLFENEKYDVLKFDAENPTLHSVNAELSKLPHTTDFPNYHPHATVGYLKKGMGKKYVEKLQGQKYEVSPSKFVYSKPDGSKIEF